MKQNNLRVPSNATSITKVALRGLPPMDTLVGVDLPAGVGVTERPVAHTGILRKPIEGIPGAI